MRAEETEGTGPRDEELRALLAAVDHAVPRISPATIATLAEARSGQRAEARWRALRWAAAVLLSVGVAGAAVATPGSPVREWVTSLVARLGPRPDESPRQPPQIERRPAALAGIALPADVPVALVFASRRAGAVAAVSLSDGDQLVVRAQPGMAHFAVEPERVLIEMAGVDDTVTVEVPRQGRRVELRTGADVLLRIERGAVTAGGQADSAGHYYVSIPPRRAAPEQR